MHIYIYIYVFATYAYVYIYIYIHICMHITFKYISRPSMESCPQILPHLTMAGSFEALHESGRWGRMTQGATGRSLGTEFGGFPVQVMDHFCSQWFLLPTWWFFGELCMVWPFLIFGEQNGFWGYPGYPAVSSNMAGNGKSRHWMEVLMGTSSINGGFSIAMFDYRRVPQFRETCAARRWKMMYLIGCRKIGPSVIIGLRGFLIASTNGRADPFANGFVQYRSRKKSIS